MFERDRKKDPGLPLFLPSHHTESENHWACVLIFAELLF